MENSTSSHTIDFVANMASLIPILSLQEIEWVEKEKLNQPFYMDNIEDYDFILYFFINKNVILFKNSTTKLFEG